MDFYHPATVRHLQLLFTTTHSHSTHVQIPTNADIYFASLSCGHVLVCLVCVWVNACVCASASLSRSPAAWVCRVLIKPPLHVERPFFQLLFRGSSNLGVTCQSVSYTLHQSIHLSSLICSQNNMIYALYEQPVNSLCVWSKHRRIHPAMVGQYFIVWRQQKHMKCCSFFSFRSAIWGGVNVVIMA